MVIALLGVSPWFATLATATEIQLSSLDLTNVQQNEGKPGIDRSASDHPIRIAGRHFAHGFGTHSPSVLHLDLAGGCSRFTAQIGITGNERLVPKSASAEFVIEGDGKVLWCSPIMRGGMNAHPVDLNLTGVKQITLRVNDGFDGSDQDEAWPEGDQRHLSSESGLYCRIYTEGLFGLQPTGLNRFNCTPRLPDGWPRMALRAIRAFDRNFDVVVERRSQKLHLTVLQNGSVTKELDLMPGETADIELH